MTIDQNTSQNELEKIYKAIVRQEFLRGTPLNIKPFLRYSLLFLLFPGMIFGFWWGLGITAAFCLILLGFMLTDHASWGIAATCTWSCLGLIPVFFVTWETLRRAQRVRSSRQMMREPLPSPTRKADIPNHEILKWRKRGENLISSIAIQAPADGIYAFLLTIEHYSGERLSTDGSTGVCVAESMGKPGTPLNALLFYRLKKVNTYFLGLLSKHRVLSPKPRSVNSIECDINAIVSLSVS